MEDKKSTLIKKYLELENKRDDSLLLEMLKIHNQIVELGGWPQNNVKDGEIPQLSERANRL